MKNALWESGLHGPALFCNHGLGRGGKREQQLGDMMPASNRRARAWGRYMSMGGSPEDEGEWVYITVGESVWPRPLITDVCMSTGLVDKNGLEIFERDIAMSVDGYGNMNPDIIRWQEGIYWIGFHLHLHEVAHKTVIGGNIRENSELLP